jgi:hypothetical protein
MAHKDNFNIGKWINENKTTNEIKVIPGGTFSLIKQEVMKKLEAEYQKDPNYFYIGADGPYIDYMNMTDQLKSAQNIETLEKVVFENLDDGYEFLFPIYRELLLKQ